MGAYEYRLNLSPRADAGGDREAWLGEEVVFDGSASTDPDGEIVAWHWDFGVGAEAEGEVVVHTFDQESPLGGFRVTLTVVDSDGSEAQDVVSVVVVERPDNVRPSADAGGDRETFAGRELVFDGSGSVDPDGEVVAWRWRFGDGDSADGEVVRHTYDAPGEYFVTLTVEDDRGGSDDHTVEVLVEEPPEPDAEVPDAAPPEPDAAAETGPALTAIVGIPITFDGSLSRDADGEIVAWIWDFGDGGGGLGERIDHAFAEAGVFTVRLTVRDDDGAEASAETTATVRVVGGPDASVVDAASGDSQTQVDGAGAADTGGSDGGCSCDVGGESPSTPALLLFTLLALGRRRRGAND